MSVTHVSAIRTSVADLVVDSLDVGSTHSGGSIFFSDSAFSEIAICRLNNPAFGAASAGVATLIVSPAVQDTSTIAGTIANAAFRDRDDVTKFNCTVAVSGGDITVPTVTIPAGVTLTVTSLTYTAMP